jgi:hypothetical protein
MKVGEKLVIEFILKNPTGVTMVGIHKRKTVIILKLKKWLVELWTVLH